MDLLGQLHKSNEVIAAAVYISVVNTDREEAERVITAQLHQIHSFANQHSIVIIDSYIERYGSEAERNRLREDARTGRYRVLLHCGDIDSDSFYEFGVVDINVLQYEGK
ncbi:hypothetical protein J27TS7_16110 [Paenibacillus dendritiformis]|uniref:hypothetical protein n=1 Tax=Paenibacillus dendritiformis TaxID=130049 RepID=UPI001B036890|nr:hypothetical protein [Paenibacillus dendritiformis]GIO72097.1 hypothetical protein J27TS7_16110 [Paenibacillus dendritiformis]